MSRPLLLIRHGQIAANAAGRWHGATDSLLTRRGRHQVARLTQRIAREWGNLAAIYSSPLLRCLHTAQPIAKALGRDVVLDDGLREYGIGELEDTTFAALQAEHDFFRRIRDDHDYAPTGGDSINSVARRIVSTLRRIHAYSEGADSERASRDRASDASTRPIAVVSHGAALAVALASLLDADVSRWTNYQIDNCSVTELLLEPEPLVTSFNSTDHLQ